MVTIIRSSGFNLFGRPVSVSNYMNYLHNLTNYMNYSHFKFPYLPQRICKKKCFKSCLFYIDHCWNTVRLAVIQFTIHRSWCKLSTRIFFFNFRIDAIFVIIVDLSLTDISFRLSKKRHFHKNVYLQLSLRFSGKTRATVIALDTDRWL